MLPLQLLPYAVAPVTCPRIYGVFLLRPYADQHPGFSTIWANMLSCMPEADQLLKARVAKQAVLKGPQATAVFETEAVSVFLCLVWAPVRFFL